MRRTRIGDLDLMADGPAVRFQLGDEASAAVTLEQQELRALIRFAYQTLQTDLNQRQAARLNVPEDCEIGVQLLIHDRRVPARARDLSLSGVQLELPASGQFRPLFIQETLQVELELRGESVTLDARVVRQAGPTYGLNFPDCMRDGELCPPPALSRIVGMLQDEGQTDAAPRTSP